MTVRIAVGFGVLAAIAAAVVAAIVTASGEPELPTPTKDDPAAYTIAFVEGAIQRYERDGREATVDYYNSLDSVDGEWYGFIVGEEGVTISHHNAQFRDRDPSLRVDIDGRFYGDDLLGATQEGSWIEYAVVNPTTGENGQKHTWAKRHDGLIFAAGWYGE